jgi:hypothetical protein
VLQSDKPVMVVDDDDKPVGSMTRQKMIEILFEAEAG